MGAGGGGRGEGREVGWGEGRGGKISVARKGGKRSLCIIHAWDKGGRSEKQAHVIMRERGFPLRLDPFVIE